MTSYIMDNNLQDKYAEWYLYNDVGMPLAVAVAHGLCSPTEMGVAVIEETYSLLCEELDINPNDKYESLEDILDDFIDLSDDEDEDEG